MRTIDGKEFYTVIECGAVLGASKSQLSNWRQLSSSVDAPDYGPKFIKMGGTILYAKEAVEDYIDSLKSV